MFMFNAALNSFFSVSSKSQSLQKWPYFTTGISILPYDDSALNQSAIFGFFSRNLSKYVTDGAGPIENFLKKWVAGQGLELGISRMADHCSNHYTKLTACQIHQKLLILNFISNFLQKFAKYCKMFQINYIETPMIMINISNNFDPKTTGCLIW